MQQRFLDTLQCPACQRGFKYTPSSSQPLAGSDFGVLSCDAHEYPVVDGIAILRDGRIDAQDHCSEYVEVEGPSVGELLAIVKSSDPLDALVRLLAFPPAVPLGLEKRRRLRTPFTRGPVGNALMNSRRKQVREWLEAPLEQQTAQQWMELFYLKSRYAMREMYPYFFLRFGQPRYLASLGLASAIPADERPLLDLACGLGHIMHYLSVRENPIYSIGVDRNFFQLWIGRRFVAPDSSSYVCADALKPLPFKDDAFSVSVCTDAFHLLSDQKACLNELKRCAVDDTVVIDRIGNGLLEPRDTDFERSPAGYAELIGETPYRMVSEKDLLSRYLAGRGPALATFRSPSDFDQDKWLSLVMSKSSKLFVDHGAFKQPPHGEGPLGLNPVYRVEPKDSQVRLMFEFPSTWYAFENWGMLEYHAYGLRLERPEFDALVRGSAADKASTSEFVRRFVLLGLPERYAKRPVI